MMRFSDSNPLRLRQHLSCELVLLWIQLAERVHRGVCRCRLSLQAAGEGAVGPLKKRAKLRQSDGA
eukprot:6207719-Pleurochrysis_carterae.AAC.1